MSSTFEKPHGPDHIECTASFDIPETQPPSRPNPSADFPNVDGYEILAELGRGGMGVVYRARHLALRRVVALKMIHHGQQGNAAAQQRFRAEAEAVARLQHPNIVQVHDVGEHDGRPFLALEYVDGGSLKQRIARRPLPEREAAHLVETIARAIHHVHERDVLHRDLNPNNILLTAEGQPKVTDFGLAKLVDADEGPTRTATLLGTPSYMAPEQINDAKNIGIPADVYALGAVLYELLTGRPPFRGATLMQVLELVRTREPEPVRRVRGAVSTDLETICLRCLEKDVARRYPTALALADELRRFLDGEPIRARRVSLCERAWRAVKRRPGRLAAVACTTALLCAASAIWLHTRSSVQLAHHQADERYQQFVRRRNDAFFYQLLESHQGKLFGGAEGTMDFERAELAATDALALAGMKPSDDSEVAKGEFPESRRIEITADCYALLLLLAEIRVQRSPGNSSNPEAEREVLQILEHARSIGADSRAYHLQRARVLEQFRQFDDARIERERAEALPLESVLDHFLVGEELYRGGKLAEAAKSFERVLAVQPDHFWSHFYLAVCSLRAQQWTAAKEGLNACLSQRPDFVWAYLFRSFANEKLLAVDEARIDFEKALAMNPGDDARYVLYMTRGIHHFNQADAAQAEADFRAAIELKPEQYNGPMNLAYALMAQGRFDQAQDQLQAALRFHPPQSVVAGYHLERCKLLLYAKRNDDALRASDAALQLAPEQAIAFELRGRALLALGQFALAEQAFDTAVQKGATVSTDLFRGRGQARMKLGQYPEAAEDYARVLEREPDAEIYAHRGWALFFSEAWKLALREFERSIEMNSNSPDPWVGRGLSSVRLGKYREAVSDADSALRLRPTTPEMLHNIACIYSQCVQQLDEGNDLTARAIEALRQSLDLVPAADRSSFWHDKVLPEKDLEPIRGDKRFKRLAEEVARGTVKNS